MSTYILVGLSHSWTSGVPVLLKFKRKKKKERKEDWLTDSGIHDLI